MRITALALLFGFIGAAIGEEEGILPGIMFGILVSMVLGQRSRIATLEREAQDTRNALELLKRDVAQRAPAAAQQVVAPVAVAAATAPRAAEVLPPAPQAVEVAPTPTSNAAPTYGEAPVRIDVPAQPVPEQAVFSAPPDERGHVESDAGSETVEPAVAAQPAASPSPSRELPPWAEDAPQQPMLLDGVEKWLRELVFGGNTIVRAGIFVLLVGVVLLLRYAAEHALFPIELRMAAAGLVAIALVAVGYRQREARPGFGRTLQGGGVAALYLVVFFSFRTYQLIPASLAFGLLVCIALSSGILAVLQDALALIVIGQIGGFMAPVLASTGSGSHVALFSYYLLLNVLVFAVAWFKPWRALNLIGFAFTFGVGSSWGALRYRAEDFASTEPFLIAFFVLYSLIPVLYALRRPEEKGGWVDASLVFGTPLAVLILQYAMVKDMRFGMAYSALGLAAFYVGLSRFLYKRAPEALRRLIESFLAIGIGFATLAVPYGFDNHDFTGATWALEGAGLYWVGTRQKRWLSRLAGTLLQLMAAGALLVQGARHEEDALPFVNARFLAALILCLACLFVAYRAHHKRAELPRYESAGLQTLIGLGLLFYLFSGFEELHQHLAESVRPGGTLAFALASLLGLSLLARRLDWLPGRFPAVGMVLLMPMVLLNWEGALKAHPLGHAGWLAFPLYMLLCVDVLRTFAPAVPLSLSPLHCVFFWSWTWFAALEVQHVVADYARLNQTWSSAAAALILAVALVLSVRNTLWPMREIPATYVSVGGSLLAFVSVLWLLWANGSLSGDAAPLPFFPLLNPLDLVQLALFAALWVWYRGLCELTGDKDVRAAIPIIMGGLAFFWFNALLARSVHHFAGVSFDADALWDSTPLQVSLSVSWSLLGLLGTVRGSLSKLRWLWIVSASLLGVVVAKLFLIDLAQLSTIAKIATFLVVGLLLVLVGYFAPVPPPRAATTGKDEGLAA